MSNIIRLEVYYEGTFSFILVWFQIRKVQDDLSSPSAILLIALPASYTCLSPTSLSTEVLLKVEKCCVVRSVVISRRDAVEDVENIW